MPRSTTWPSPVRSRANSAASTPCAANIPETMSTMATPSRYGRPVGGAGDAHQAAFGLHHRVVAGLVAPRAGLAVARDRAVDDARVGRAHRRRVEADAVERARDGSSRPRRRPAASSLPTTSRPPGVLKSMRDALLVAVDAQEVGALLAQERRPPPRVSSPRPGCSSLMTRAPRSPRIIVQYGPESTRVKSSTVMPVSGPIRCGVMVPAKRPGVLW